MRFFVGLATLLVCATANAAQTYKITALEFGTDLNDNGDVVGFTSDGSYQMKLYSGGTTYDLGGTTNYGVGGINNAGEITYRSSRTEDWQRASYSGGTLTTIETYAGSSILNTLNAVNDLGQAVGTVFPGADPYLLENGTITYLGSILGMGGDSRVHDINNSGIAVGSNTHSTCCGYDAVIYENGGITNIGSFDGAKFGTANAINDAGVIVGRSGNGGVLTEAMIYQDGVMSSLGKLYGFTDALDINNLGIVVGTSESSSGRRAFVYVDGQMLDLTTLVADLKEYAYLSSATAINDNGQILGTGVRADGSTGYFLATVVPVPPAIWLFGSAIAWLGWRRRR